MTLDELKHYLDSAENEFGLDSIATHGFLTATIVGRPLPDWQSFLFERQESQVPKDVRQALTAWRDSLLDQLKAENPIALPFFDNDNDDEPIDFSEESEITLWSIGFVDAMYANEENDWFFDPDTQEDVATLTLPMVVFSGVDDELDYIRDNVSIMVDMVNSIEENLTELFLLFHTPEA